MASKRAAESEPEDTADTSKRFRSAIDESVDGFMCPITHALPLVPVMAEDSKVYERTAIEDWLKQHQRSPVTNLPMGTKLVAATQIKNMIEVMVKSGALPNDKTTEWRKRIQQQERLSQLRAKAEAGDSEAAHELGKCYKFGKDGAELDSVMAVKLYKQAAEAGNAKSMAALASAYKFGSGVVRNDALALRWAAAAHHLGDATGTMMLGRLYLHGDAGLPVEKPEGFKLFKQGCDGGGSNSAGLLKLALLYFKGEGTDVDMDQAVHYVRKAVELNDPASSAQKGLDWLIALGLSIDADE